MDYTTLIYNNYPKYCKKTNYKIFMLFMINPYFLHVKSGNIKYYDYNINKLIYNMLYYYGNEKDNWIFNRCLHYAWLYNATKHLVYSN